MTGRGLTHDLVAARDEQIAALTADLARAQDNALLHASRNVALEADLARVTAERDGLLAAAKRVVPVVCGMRQTGVTMDQDAWASLRAVVEACEK